MEDILNQKICIIGLGKEGVSAANYLGKNNKITIVDQKKKEKIDAVFFEKLKISKGNFYFDGKLPESLDFDYVIRSPGVRPDHQIIKTFIQKGANLISTTKMFFDLCPCPIIGVTGTKGKGTTSTLIYEMLKASGKKAFLAGNIGTPALDVLEKLDNASFVVLELSSFQLIDLKKSPHIAVVLMITSEHMDWHTGSEEYKNAKESVVKFQKKTDFAVINQDFEISKSFARKTKAKVYFFSTQKEANGSFLDNGRLITQINGKETIAKTVDVRLPGKHNLQNVLAAATAVKILGVTNETILKVMQTFKGLPNRLQLVDEIDDVKYYNDSFSTTPETTIAAIEAFSNPKILILGGSSKKSDFSNLAQKIIGDSSIKTLILIGDEAKTIRNAIQTKGSFNGKIIEGLKDIKEIVESARSHSSPGDIVILSPACASFDMFKNYQDRGEQFEKEVKSLKTK